ncbi:MAG: hypothetical protein KAY62_00125 [Burkholderiaceae bacterium]|nr:hypothetical protein [Burkholderiaceae bacterium]
MSKKTTKRKQSRVVVETYLQALEPISHLSEEERESAIKTLLQKKREYASLPALNQHIIKVGIIDAKRGYTDDDIQRFHDAQQLASRELSTPNDFVSEGTNSAIQKKRAQAPRIRKNDDYREIWDYAKRKIRREEPISNIWIDAVEFFSDRGFDKRKIQRAIKWGKEQDAR